LSSAVEGNFELNIWDRVSARFDCAALPEPLRLRDRRTLSLRSARRLLPVLFSPLSFRFYDFMKRIELSPNQCLLLRPAPAFDLSLPPQSIIVMLGFLRSPHEFHWTTHVSIRGGLHPLLMLPEAFIDIVCTPRVIGTVRAFKDVDNVGHKVLFLPERSECPRRAVEG
jgi:hypothetical protein